MTRSYPVHALALCALVAACSGGGGSSASPNGPPASVTPIALTPSASSSPTPRSSATGWRLTIYYTPVMSYYSGALQTVTGCPTISCANGSANLGSYPNDFVAAVKTEGTGKIAAGRYLNWSAGIGYWLDTLPRDAQGNPLMPYRSAAADPSIPYGTTFRIGSCGADTTTGTPTDATVCASYTRPTWIVTDRFTTGTVGQHVDLYVGDQASPAFTSSSAFIDASGASLTSSAPVAPSSIWKPGPSDTFQWILNAPLDTGAPASVYDIDAFNATSTDVATLHGLGRHVVCYVNAGAYENFRSDASSFPASVIGNPYTGWPGENWLDVRRIDLLGPIMAARLDQCKSKGFDAVEPDNIDGYQNATGFPLGADDQAVYDAWFASLAHERGLSIALKNDASQVGTLQPLYDFALTEDCWQQGWCARVAPFHAAGQAVFNVEYTDVTTATTFTGTYCPQAKAAGFDAILKNRALDAPITLCP